MFDMSWGEMLIIGGVALVAIGPKDLPKALRTLGQVVGKARRMAGQFQSQFNEAIREADLEELRKDVSDINDAVAPFKSQFDPIKNANEQLQKALGVSESFGLYETTATSGVEKQSQPSEIVSDVMVQPANEKKSKALKGGGTRQSKTRPKDGQTSPPNQKAVPTKRKPDSAKAEQGAFRKVKAITNKSPSVKTKSQAAGAKIKSDKKA